MSHETLDPEIRALLEEVARDPRARLLRVERLHLPVREEAPVGRASARLASAERQLVEVHRHELARLLFEASRRAIYEHPTAAATLHRSENMERQVELGDPEEWSKRAGHALAMTGGEFEVSDSTALLAACSGLPAAGRPSAMSLALASLRLVPRPAARMCVAHALMQGGHAAAAIHVAHGIVCERPSPRDLSYAWEIVGLAEWGLARLDAAVSAYEAAASTREVRSPPLLNLFALELERADLDAVLSIVDRIEATIPLGHPSIEEFVGNYQSKQAGSSWRLPKAGRDLLAGIENRLQPVARSVTRAFT